IKEATTTVVPISEEIDTSPCTEIEKDQYAFPDICKHTLSDYIENLYDLGVVNGFDNGMFKPEEPVTRGQMATFITRAFKLSVDTSGNCFSDVPDDYPHKLDIQALCNVEIVQGYGDGTFRPDNPLKRGEATKFIALTMFQKGYDITTYEDHSFPDVLEGNPFNPYISFLSGITINDAKVINGYSSGEFGPDDSMTRAQMAKVVSLSIDYTP
ncbi:S-layer homology domain-containing protein, partial [Candidatus Dojkabacteria bacterium]|nr:S-layer homology domain-containing protein [Candidatus Dojkabacteria bacterium]